jgi:hypothetical protein
MKVFFDTAATFAAAYFPKKIFNFFLTTSKLFYSLFHALKFVHQMPSHSQEIQSFIQVKQNKISWDKFQI